MSRSFWDWLFDDECYTETLIMTKPDGSTLYRFICDTRKIQIKEKDGKLISIGTPLIKWEKDDEEI